MTANGWLQIGVFFAAIAAVTPPLGRFMTRVFNRERTPLDPILRPIERAIYRATGVDETHEMRWTEYAAAMLVFSGVSMLVLYLLQRVQQSLPFNPQHFGAVTPDLAFNTAASFTTNTNWQAYSGELTMSYLTQMAGLAYHNFVSAAVGVALAIAFIRGIARREQDAIGNFWVDTVRCLLWILLPFCVAGTVLLVSQGVVQNLRPYDIVTTIEGKPQVIAQGPVASQEIIKEWGTNGGGFSTPIARIHSRTRRR
jgi:K+-transporting ATPase ATPase A chain